MHKETDPELLASSAIPLPIVKTFLAKSAAIQKILILDCQYRNNSVALKQQLASNAKGTYLISNSPDYDNGFVPSEQHTLSALTKTIIEGLENGQADLDESGNVTIDECYDYLRRQAVGQKFPPPVRWNEGVAGNWIVARTPGSAPEVAPATPARLRRHYKHIGDMFREGLAVPFLGPGAVLEELAEEIAEGDRALPELLPVERNLAQGIGKFAEVPEALHHNPLTVLAQYGQLHMVGGRPHFYRQLKRHFPSAGRPGPVHRFLVQQEKPMLVVTACYDNLLEEIFQENGKKFALVTHVAHAEDAGHLGKIVVQYSDRLDQAEICLSDELSIDLDEWWVFYKIQGTFDLFTKGLGGKEEIDSIVISEEDYLSFVSRLSDQHRTIPALFNRPFQQRMFTFLGYRLSDWNFRTLIHILRGEERMRKIEGYAVRENISEFEAQYWKSKSVQIIDCTVGEFVQGVAAEMGLRI